jgi:hypothetical protein
LDTPDRSELSPPLSTLSSFIRKSTFLLQASSSSLLRQLEQPFNFRHPQYLQHNHERYMQGELHKQGGSHKDPVHANSDTVASRKAPRYHEIICISRRFPLRPFQYSISGTQQRVAPASIYFFLSSFNNFRFPDHFRTTLRLSQQHLCLVIA